MNDATIRKLWLALLLVNPLISLPITFWQMQANPQWAQAPSTFLTYFYFFFVTMISVIFFALYHFCYKKRGTKVLLAYLISTSCTLLYSIYALLADKLPSYLAEMPYYKSVYIVSWMFSALWMITSFRLWQANREWRKSA